MTTTHELSIPGGNLFYKVHGRGPVLLVLQGGAADADGSDGLAEHLAPHFTVVSYDRRGLSRSRLAGPPDGLTIATHADDAHRILAAVTEEPAFLLGVSIGGVIGLDLTLRYAARVRTMVAHEPPLNALLSEPDQAHLKRGQLALEDTFAREGAPAAMAKFVAMLGLRHDDREADAPMASRGPHLLANLEFFITHDAPAVRAYTPDLAKLRASRSSIVPAVGHTSRPVRDGALPHAEAVAALASLLDVPLVQFPGGHGGYASHPRAFAARLREVLETSDTSAPGAPHGTSAPGR